jgi:hypothetical protein
VVISEQPKCLSSPGFHSANACKRLQTNENKSEQTPCTGHWDKFSELAGCAQEVSAGACQNDQECMLRAMENIAHVLQLQS